MDTNSPSGQYHVVCRDCAVERLFNDAADATTLERAHVAETGHSVAVGRIV
ncbi:hypothetical protein [Halorubrum tebenquichense]|uniref:Uncharacterized protein n=1 Tax=Halorubrum tebenquichense DSM 14210 TaxID=1227485 RepID=M0DWY5_9EURY|nr:hypothetical protein [Halorubrum tebenquichense]ELZ39242.1 hypothetical protein C472_04970 [Halorubrum tebenquichense DSM 14210]